MYLVFFSANSFTVLDARQKVMDIIKIERDIGKMVEIYMSKSQNKEREKHKIYMYIYREGERRGIERYMAIYLQTKYVWSKF